MRIYSFGIAALVGTLLLFVAWLADREKRAGIERLERWEAPHLSGKSLVPTFRPQWPSLQTQPL